MDVFSKVVSVLKLAKEIYNAVEDVRQFKQRSKTISALVQAISRPVEELKKRCTKEELEQYRTAAGESGDHGHGCNDSPADGDPASWIASIVDLEACLKEIQLFLKKLSNQNFIKKMLKKRNIEDKFDGFNNNLQIFGLSLTTSLHVHAKFNFVTKDMVNEVIAKLDDARLKYENLAEGAKNANNMLSELHFQQQLQNPSENEGHIKYSDLRFVTKIHDGKYGPIYKATHGCENKMLVFKTFEDTGLAARRELKEQCIFWMGLGFSKFIVHLYGYTINDESEMCFVVEYMARGTLRSVLQDERKNPLSWEQRIALAHDCAQGLCAIHRSQSKTLLHRAITSTRFMVDEDYRAKISDNGFVTSVSKISTSEAAISNEGLGSVDSDELNYLCPEQILSSFKRTVKSEVYKLGVVFYEIASRKKPFQAMEEKQGRQLTDEEKVDFIKAGKFEEVPAGTPSGFRKLINDCRSESPSKRPSTYDVVCCLEKIRFPEVYYSETDV